MYFWAMSEEPEASRTLSAQCITRTLVVPPRQQPCESKHVMDHMVATTLILVSSNGKPKSTFPGMSPNVPNSGSRIWSGPSREHYHSGLFRLEATNRDDSKWYKFLWAESSSSSLRSPRNSILGWRNCSVWLCFLSPSHRSSRNAPSRTLIGLIICTVTNEYPLPSLSFDVFLVHSPAVIIMSKTPPTILSSSNYQSIFNLALDAYREKTKSDLASHPLLSKLESCSSPDATLALLREQIPRFDQARNGDDKLMRWLNPAVKVLYSFSATFGGGASLVSFGVLKRHMQEPSLIYPIMQGISTCGGDFHGNWCPSFGQ